MPSCCGHPGEPLVAEFVNPALAQLNRAVNRFGALGDHADEMRISALEAPFDQPAHLFDIEGLLGDQRHVRARSQAGVQCDPAGVPAHHLDQHHSLMRFGGAVQPVDGVGGHHQCGVVAESHVGAVDVVVDGLGHTDDRNVFLGQPVRGRQRAFAADRDEDVDTVVIQRLLDLVQPGPQLVGVRAGGAQHRSALGQQPVVAVVVLELHAPVLQQPAPAVLESDHRRAVPGVAGAHYRPDDGVEARAVAAAGENSDPHALILHRALASAREQTQNRPKRHV